MSNPASIFRITIKNGGKIADTRLYQSKKALDKWWLKKINFYKEICRTFYNTIEIVSEQIVDGAWVQIDYWNSEKEVVKNGLGN